MKLFLFITIIQSISGSIGMCLILEFNIIYDTSTEIHGNGFVYFSNILHIKLLKIPTSWDIPKSSLIKLLKINGPAGDDQFLF